VQESLDLIRLRLSRADISQGRAKPAAEALVTMLGEVRVEVEERDRSEDLKKYSPEHAAAIGDRAMRGSMLKFRPTVSNIGRN
jgi:hypothetical protein